MDRNKTRRPWRRRLKIWFSIFSLSALLIFFWPVIFFSFYIISMYGFSAETLSGIGRFAEFRVITWTVDLASDEEMIANFKAHREDFQRLTQLYVAEGSCGELPAYYVGEGKSELRASPETRILLERTGIGRINGTPIGGLWLPNPYSIETAKNAQKYDSIPTNPFQALNFTFKGPFRHVSASLRYRRVTKALFYVPVQPKIENGELLFPVGLGGNYQRRALVLPSLNSYPAIWERDRPDDFDRYQCVYRQIEPQWFIEMCRTQ